MSIRGRGGINSIKIKAKETENRSSNTISVHKKIAIDQGTRYVVSAFVRAIHNEILSQSRWNNIYSIIPNVIITFLLSYIGAGLMINSGIYEWRIIDPKLLNSIKTAKNKQSFESEEFEIGKLSWKIELFPNGNHEQRVGLFGVFLKCMKLPSIWNHILILRTIECKETNSRYTFITKCFSGQSKGWASGSLFLGNVLHLNSLTFIVKIRILRIIKNEISKIKGIYYQYKSPYIDNINEWEYHISWRIDEKLMNEFKNCIHGQIFENNYIVEDMWKLRCCPKGIKGKVNGETVLILQLCSLPYNIDRMEVELRLSCYIPWSQKTLVYDVNTVWLQYDNCCAKWKDNSLFLVQIQDYVEIEFKAEIIIKSKYDINGNYINYKRPSEIEQHWNDVIKQQNENNNIKRKVLMMETMINSMQRQIIMQNNKIRELEGNMVKSDGGYNENVNKKQIDYADGNEVGVWLKNIVGLQQYAFLLINNGFDDFEAIKEIKIEYLESLGIDKMGHRLKLMKYIQKLQ